MISPGRAAVVLIGPESATLGVYARLDSGRVRAHARRTAPLPDAAWPAVREALHQLVALARARRADAVTVALRATLRAVRWRTSAADEARRLGCEPLALTSDDELRWLFLGSLHDQRAQNGVVAELERDGMALARFRGRLLAATARIGLGAAPADSGLVPGRCEALIASGSLVAQLAARLGAANHQAALTRTAVARLARTRGPDAAAALALRRLMDWTGQDTAAVARDALVHGLAATLLHAPVPYVG